jgi:hypothetical protein
MFKKNRIKTSFISLLFLAVVFFNVKSEAKIFKSGYVTFEMQDSWDCLHEQTEWVCRADKSTPEAKEAVIVVTAKQVGPTDKMDLYRKHMDNPIITQTKTGNTLNSIVKYKSEVKKINDVEWLDALHQDSEVKNYFTRYLATVKGPIAILVAFSAHNSVYAKHSANFDKAIQSMRVIQNPDELAKLGVGVALGGNEAYGRADGIGGMLAMEDGSASQGRGSLFKNPTFLGLSLLVFAIIAYILLRAYSKK